MADEDEKREARRFEPPPWERDRFDALKERQAEGEVPPERQAAGEPAQEPSAGGPGPSAAPTAEKAEPEAVSDAKVGAMLIQLSAEEPRVDRHVKTVGVFSAGVLMFVGVCMLAWGGILLLSARGNVAASAVALSVLVMGALIGGVGLVIGLRVTRGQGD